jgi:hypothetical protein
MPRGKVSRRAVVRTVDLVAVRKKRADFPGGPLQSPWRVEPKLFCDPVRKSPAVIITCCVWNGSGFGV